MRVLCQLAYLLVIIAEQLAQLTDPAAMSAGARSAAQRTAAISAANSWARKVARSTVGRTRSSVTDQPLDCRHWPICASSAAKPS